MKKLKKLNISSLTHLEVGQFITRNLEDLQTMAIQLNTDPLLENQINLLKDASIQFDKSVNQIKKQKETEELNALDKARDMAFSAFNRQLSVYEISDNPNEVMAYKAIKIVWNNYKSLPSYSFEAQTKATQQLYEELSQAKFANDFAVLPTLVQYLQRLKNTNDNFNTKFSIRSADRASTEVLDTKKLRTAMIDQYMVYANYVLGQVNISNNAFHLQLLTVINTIRKYFADLKAG